MRAQVLIHVYVWPRWHGMASKVVLDIVSLSIRFGRNRLISCNHRPHHSLHVTSTCLHLDLNTVHLRSVYFSLPGCVYLNIQYYNLSSRISQSAHRCLLDACTAGTAALSSSKSTHNGPEYCTCPRLQC